MRDRLVVLTSSNTSSSKMYKIILIIFVSALLSLQVNGASDISFVPSDGDNDAKKLYDELWQVTYDSINEAVTDFKSFFDYLYNTTVTRREEGLSEINNKSEEYISLVSSMKDSVISAGLNITRCLGPELAINELQETNSQDLLACVNNLAIAGIFDLNGQIANLIKSMWHQVYDKMELDFCVLNYDNCIADGIVEIERYIPTVASTISTFIENGRGTMELHIADVESCINITMSKLEVMASAMIGEVKTCVNEI